MMGNELENLSPAELSRYQRQIILPEVGIEGQALLRNTRVLVIGAGGLGSPVLIYLAAAGIGTLGIIDPDVVDETNLQRQILYKTSDVGRKKTEAVAERLLGLNSGLSIDTFPELLTTENAARLCAAYDIVVDGCDNFATRYLVNDACVVTERPLVSGSVFRFQGLVSVFNYTDAEGRKGPTYRCLFPEPPPSSQVPSCGEIGVLGVVPGLIGVIQAQEVIKIALRAGVVLSGRLIIIDTLRSDFQSVSLLRNETVAAGTRILSAAEYARYSACDIDGIKQISPAELQERLSREDIMLIDVRESFEREMCSIGGLHVPLREISNRAGSLPRDKPIVIYCKSGARSAKAIQELQDAFGFTNLYNLEGGILMWSTD